MLIKAPSGLLLLLIINIGALQFKKGLPYDQGKTNKKLLQLDNISGKIYSDSFSRLRNVEELRITLSTIKEVENNGLCPAGVKNLTIIRNYNFPNLTRAFFGDCPTLSKVVIWGNDNVYIQPGTFSGLRNLAALEITPRIVPKLDKIFLQNLPNLKNLFVGDEIEEIESDAFVEVQNLQELTLDNGESLKPLKIPSDLFVSLKKMRRLTLRNVDLNNWDTLRSINPNLDSLDLQYNNLENFDVPKIIRYLPNLKLISIKNNPVGCQYLQEIGHLLRRKIKDVVVDALVECYDELNESLILGDR